MALIKPDLSREVDLKVAEAPVHPSLDWSVSADSLADLTGVVAVIPAFNEERHVGSVVLRLRHVLDTVIVINDGSSDATEEVARLAGAQVITHPINKGYGAAIQTGLSAAQKLGPRAVVLMDADGQHRVEDMCDLVRPILDDEADVAVGSRFADGRTQVPRMRKVAQHGLTWLTNIGSGVKLTDSQSGMRAFGPRALDALLLSSTSMSAASEMQFLAGDAQLRVCEVPIEIRYFGDVKRSAIAQGLDVLNGIIRLVSIRRPLLFFGVPGLAVLIWGINLALDVVQTFDRTHILLVGQLIFAVAFVIVGTLTLFTAIMLNAFQGLRADLRNELRA
ncbi:MAG: glycosyltransferase family 2 protein, partial [Chloroflexi bacterium]|nr:glycosyltransferase family 2 protein [Chloroflexota bacterium]